MAEEIGGGRVGIRISPEHGIQDVVEDDRSDVLATYGALMDGLRPLGMSYLSVLHADPAGDLVQELRRRFGGGFIANSGFGSATTRDEAVGLIESAHADAVAVGRCPHRQSRPGRALARRGRRERAEPGDLLRTGCGRLHRLPAPVRLTAIGGGAGAPALALSAPDAV